MRVNFQRMEPVKREGSRIALLLAVVLGVIVLAVALPVGA